MGLGVFKSLAPLILRALLLEVIEQLEGFIELLILLMF